MKTGKLGIGAALGLMLGGGLFAGGYAAGRASLGPLAEVNPRDSLFFFPFSAIGGFGVTDTIAVKAADLLTIYLDTGDLGPVQQALDHYAELEAQGNFGGEYSALIWFCHYALADATGRKELLRNPDGVRFIQFFQASSFALFRSWLQAKYGLAPMSNTDIFFFVDEFVRFNSPGRAAWEHSDEVVDSLDIHPGMKVADIGAGAGFFSFRFLDRVGAGGTVYAVEMNKLHLDYLDKVKKAGNLSNLEVVATDGAVPPWPDKSIDRIFMCSAYQALYIFEREPTRTAFLDQIGRVLKDDGLLAISENDPTVPVLPFGGISVSRPLIQAQLEAFGFETVGRYSFIPQRYVLVFKKGG